MESNALLAVFVLVIGTTLAVPHAASAACEAGTKVDASTAETATKKLMAAEYRQIRGLKKGCDSFWHAKAMKDGVVSNVSLSPQGVITIEGN